MSVEKKQINQNMQNGVVITVYLESSRTRSSKTHLKKLQLVGGDRRAQLLTYSRLLRNNDGSRNFAQAQLPNRNESRPIRSKKRLWFAQPVRNRICSSSSTQCGHEFVESMESREKNRSKRRKGRGNYCYMFLRKLKSMLKKLSCKEIKL